MEKAAPKPRKKLSDEGIREKFRRAMLRFVAQCDPEFHEDETSRFFYDQSNFRGFLRLGPANREGTEIWKVCLSDPVVEGKTFKAQVCPRDFKDTSDLKVSLKSDSEWSEARDEAAELLGDDKSPLDSGKLGELYRWITKKEHLGKTWKGSELSKRFKIDPIRKLLNKLHLFRDKRIRITSQNCWETEVYVSESPLSEWLLTPLNPVFPEIPKEFSKTHLGLLRVFFEDLILRRNEAGSTFLVARMSTRREVKHCFPGTSNDFLKGRSYPEVLSRMPSIRGVQLFYSFAADLGFWYCGCQLSEDYTWEEVKDIIRQRRIAPPPEEQYGLSEEASQVFAWLTNHDYENFERHLSPAVENRLKLEIGIDLEKVGKKNLWQLFQLICQEISEKTEFEARPIPWAKGYYEPTMHLFFREKANIEEEALVAVRRFLWSQGIERDHDAIRAALETLVDRN